MSVILQNSYGYIIHPLPPTVHVHLQLIDKPYKQLFSMDNDSSSSKKRRKRKKYCTRPLNAGEVSMMTYHSKVREKIFNSWRSLIELGKTTGYFPVTTNLQDDKAIESHSFPINDHITPITVQILDEGKEYILKTCLNCNYEGVDLVDICNNSLSVSKPIDDTSLDVMDGDFKQKISKVDKLCGRVVVNSTKDWAIIKLSEGHFAIPNNSTFVLSDIGEFQTLIDYVKCDEKKKFDCIVLDPPWENRSAIRSHKYQWLSEYDLLQLPLPELCNNGCLVVVWVTNKVKFADFIREELFSSWNVEIVGEWHWIKITTSGELVFDLDSLHKKPYELLLLGRYQGKVFSMWQYAYTCRIVNELK